jgi:hypothetical protein
MWLVPRSQVVTFLSSSHNTDRVTDSLDTLPRKGAHLLSHNRRRVSVPFPCAGCVSTVHCVALLLLLLRLLLLLPRASAVCRCRSLTPQSAAWQGQHPLLPLSPLRGVLPQLPGA